MGSESSIALGISSLISIGSSFMTTFLLGLGTLSLACKGLPGFLFGFGVSSTGSDGSMGSTGSTDSGSIGISGMTSSIFQNYPHSFL